ncbi:MAG: YbaB/EbfC family nucleoid-associated protein [Candidatus Buchananbacteria bacterium]|nr:YbaB/EbfC family nucleoid-associated protein [Candidatus Buchananbacteria bacterium]
MFNKLKQIQDLKSQASQIKKALSAETVEGSGAWGKVKVIMDGNQEIKKIEIADELLSDKVKLENAIIEATNDTIKKVQRVMAQKMSQFGGFPGL